MTRAVVLLSGGLDSATALWWARFVKNWRCRALAFDYGQRHKKELNRARALARVAGIPLDVIKISLPWGGSSLLDKRAPLPHPAAHRIGRGPLPSTYVPARNTIFLSFALSCADAIGADRVVIGANALDYSGYPDCRPRYLTAMARVARLGTRRAEETGRPIRIEAPLLRLSKAGIVRLGKKWGVPWALTWSCYRGGPRPCGRCDSCRLRQKGFDAAGLVDPVRR